MAHRDQCRALRDDRHAGRGGVRALPLSALALVLITAVASAQAPAESRRDLAGSALTDAPSWWAEYGRAGWISDTWLGAAAPWVLGGHARGGWDLVEPGRAPHDLPFPGAGAAHSPLVWYDTLAAEMGQGGPWAGFHGSLARAVAAKESRLGTTSVIDLRGGALGFDDNALLVDRRDSLAWFRGEAYSANRLAAGALDISGRHVWGISGGLRHGDHALELSFAQRGAATRLVGSEEESNSAKSGSATYRLRRGAWRGSLGFARGTGHAESFADFYDLSRRDADETRVEAGVEHGAGFTGRVEYRRGRVARTVSEDAEWRARSLWGAARWTRPVEDGVLEIELGAGKHGTRERPDWAPAVSFRTGAGAVTARVGIERVLHAVWSDLGGGDPFMQDTWAGALGIGLGEGTPHAGRLQFLGGRTKSRAVMTRVPNTEFALRTGILPDPAPWSFGLLCADARWRHRAVSVGGEGFALWRPDAGIQTRVDPGFGARGWAETGFPWFGGDLGIVVHGALEAVGPREVENDPGTFLPGYVSGEATARFSIADALVTLRVRNLENVIREQPWIDSATGEPALGTGREWRLAFTMLLRN